MMKRVETILALTGIALGLAIAPLRAQSGGDMKDKAMDKMSMMSKEEKAAMFDKMPDSDKMKAMGKMSVDDKAMMYDQMHMNAMSMDKMPAMSNEEKAAMFDKMPEPDKMKAAKMAGHDMSKMSGRDRKMAMGKMSTDEKAMMYDRMHMDTMGQGSMKKAKK